MAFVAIEILMVRALQGGGTVLRRLRVRSSWINWARVGVWKRVSYFVEQQCGKLFPGSVQGDSDMLGSEALAELAGEFLSNSQGFDIGILNVEKQDGMVGRIDRGEGRPGAVHLLLPPTVQKPFRGVVLHSRARERQRSGGARARWARWWSVTRWMSAFPRNLENGRARVGAVKVAA